ncbi:MAG: hypothetical protein KJZ70_00695 [Bryobacterales bacterium]|nr:hypothetical protein [Bryobacterales bacterium]
MTGIPSASLSLSARWQTGFYRAAASLLSAHCLAAPEVESIYIRRSVAAGEAQFPWSDVDLGIVLSPFANEEDEGRALERLWGRFRMTRLLFPRLGEAEVHVGASLAESAIDDPYRASIDRRAAVLTHGSVPDWATVPITPRDAIRRLIFWFDGYLPRSLGARNHRNAHKFAIEIWNAWLAASGGIQEPFLRRQDAEDHWRHGADASLLAQAESGPEGAFRACLAVATRAHSLLRSPLPRLAEPLSAEIRFLPGSARRTIHLLPTPASPLPGGGPRPTDLIVTPEALALFLGTQNPFLWHSLPARMQDILECPPSREDWLLACRRLASGQRLRVAGFVEHGSGSHLRRLEFVRHALSALERGETPSSGGIPKAASGPPAREPSIAAYYREQYPSLLREAASLRLRAQLCLAPPASRSADGNGENVRGGI